MGYLECGEGMKPIILKLARDDLKDIHTRLSEYGMNPPVKFRESFERFCNQVEKMPYLYSQYEQNTIFRRAVLAYDYLVFYQVESTGRVKIYRVLYGKRDILPIMDE